MREKKTWEKDLEANFIGSAGGGTVGWRNASRDPA